MNQNKKQNKTLFSWKYNPEFYCPFQCYSREQGGTHSGLTASWGGHLDFWAVQDGDPRLCGAKRGMLSSSIIICFLPYRKMLILENRGNQVCLTTEMNPVGQLNHFSYSLIFPFYSFIKLLVDLVLKLIIKVIFKNCSNFHEYPHGSYTHPGKMRLTAFGEYTD